VLEASQNVEKTLLQTGRGQYAQPPVLPFCAVKQPRTSVERLTLCKRPPPFAHSALRVKNQECPFATPASSIVFGFRVRTRA
jgi:hypothetical protein